ncbi:hypothetical protein BOX15_Mlig027161g1 [Macrostomum lignano]|uniref:Uncharacterized protein n=2 Tax=Macrostomum lignano TaxID=282301 RepID=A0A267FX43_9PLAT|nr:hypothetical protein BOX15_Mlig027161g2 [Macrostomum lignano]PAA89035.1 hypothetical protein BOX15_Mlig027161g1 [Macrostomum lignano]
MAFVFALIWALVATSTMASGELVTLTAEQKQAILDAHNVLRARTAMGLVGNQPKAANMPALEWDDRLMDSANNWVKQCVAGHDSGSDRALTGYSWVGQNWAGGYSGNFSYYVDLWFREYKDYTFATKSCSAVCGHYTQVVWAKTTLVGCGVSRCSNYPYTIVCNYATGGNYNGEYPYVSGDDASQCNGEYVFKQRGLCMRKDQCNSGDCTCSISSCLNGGVLDSANCKCTCPDGFYGNKCEKPCVDSTLASDYCSYSTICSYSSYAPRCPKKCNLCKPVTLRDLNVVNRDNVKSRSPM